MDAFLARHILKRGLRRPVAAWLGRSFPTRARRRMLIYYHPSAITWAQVHPFVAYRRTLAARFGAAIRCRPVAELLAGDMTAARGADIVLVAPWFTVEPARLSQALERLAATGTAVSFLDTYAANDLRLGAAVDPHVRFYLKKSLFRDRRQHARTFRGDTNLEAYYGDLFGLRFDPVDWGVPGTLLPKLRLSPNFLTAPQFIGAFRPGASPPQEGRNLDMQLRLGRRGSPRYAAMRGDALDRARGIAGLSVSPEGKIGYAAYMDEMRAARLCFSPFGYGELCWRDIEGFLTGSVVIKPDMGHLETLPELYEPGVTYLPCRWDHADLEEVVRGALADPDLRRRLAETAHARCADYLASGESFAADMAFLFESA
ncbi:MAG TPA: glycosyltransferase [Pseudohaliea sp.]|nr:glycosyltransferase [Pseudohaliea sp.]